MEICVLVRIRHVQGQNQYLALSDDVANDLVAFRFEQSKIILTRIALQAAEPPKKESA